MTDTAETFYLGCAYNLPDEPGGGARIARKIVRALEQTTGDRCVSRWMWDADHGAPGLGLMAATADIQDVARARYVVVIMLTPTSRGAHVEIGLSLGLGKRTYLLSANGRDPTAFDKLCLPLPPHWKEAVLDILEQEGHTCA